MNKLRIGLLPFYVELYDRDAPEKRENFVEFYRTIAREFEMRGIEVIEVPLCRVKKEFADSVKKFEQEQVDAIVTLHVSYSPSLESIEALTSAKLPVIILDTTPAYGFGPDQSPDEIFYNHGIHGVQDLCNLLVRNKKAFQIEVGHWQKSDVIDRVAKWVRAASLVRAMRNARVGIIGKPFKGMGDFCVPGNKLESCIGITTIPFDPEIMNDLAPGIDNDAVRAEMSNDISIFDIENVNEEAYTKTVRACLMVRKWIEKEKLTAFTLNFTDVNRDLGFSCVPFMEASKAMARGLGYAGEGDVLTAALVGALLSMYPHTTFTEMFCPDWEGNTIFSSHMGEMNIRLAAQRARLIEMEYTYTDMDNPVVAVGRLREGEAVLVNLAPGPDDSFSLVLSPVEVIGVDGTDKLENTIHGWFKPSKPIDEFLALYSLAGGTHHSALVYGNVLEDIVKFGRLMGWQVVVID